MNIDLTDPKFHGENAAREWLQEARWQGRPWCPHCGSFEVNRMEASPDRQKKVLATAPGLFHCPDCRGRFTVRTGQVMERSHVPLAKWVLAYHLMAASKNCARRAARCGDGLGTSASVSGASWHHWMAGHGGACVASSGSSGRRAADATRNSSA